MLKYLKQSQCMARSITLPSLKGKQAHTKQPVYALYDVL